MRSALRVVEGTRVTRLNAVVSLAMGRVTQSRRRNGWGAGGRVKGRVVVVVVQVQVADLEPLRSCAQAPSCQGLGARV